MWIPPMLPSIIFYFSLKNRSRIPLAAQKKFMLHRKRIAIYCVPLIVCMSVRLKESLFCILLEKFIHLTSCFATPQESFGLIFCGNSKQKSLFSKKFRTTFSGKILDFSRSLPSAFRRFFERFVVLVFGSYEGAFASGTFLEGFSFQVRSSFTHNIV